VRREESIQRRLLELFAETGAAIEALTISCEDWNSPRWRVMPFHRNVDADGIELTPNGHAAPAATEEQMAEARRALIRTWLEQAHETLDDAEYLANGKRWKSCVGRLYYASSYAVTALLLSRGYNFSSHRGVQILFNEHFGQAGAVPAGLVALYNQLHRNRLLADYSGTTEFEEAQVSPWIAETRRFLALIEQLVQPSSLGH